MNTAILEEIKIKVLPILKQAEVKKAALFGSYVRGDNNETSDIDILVELPDNATLFELGGLKVTLEEKLKKNVDVVTYKSISPIIKESIFRNQYPLL
jgi:predicted nucleotidyltransferase